MSDPMRGWWIALCVACAGPAQVEAPTPDAGVRCLGPFETLCDGPCTSGTARCLDLGTIEHCLDGRWVTSGCAVGTCQFGVGPERAAACATSDFCYIPGTIRCDGPSVRFCNHENEEVVLRTCDFGCDDGACVGPVCTPGRIRCDGGSLRRCNAIGSYEATESCAKGCLEEPAPARCVE